MHAHTHTQTQTRTHTHVHAHHTHYTHKLSQVLLFVDNTKLLKPIRLISWLYTASTRTRCNGCVVSGCLNYVAIFSIGPISIYFLCDTRFRLAHKLLLNFIGIMLPQVLTVNDLYSDVFVSKNAF